MVIVSNWESVLIGFVESEAARSKSKSGLASCLGWAQGCVPEKIPIPDTREFGLEYGYLPKINTRKKFPHPTQLIPNTRAKYPTCRVGFSVPKKVNLGVCFGLFDPNSVHTHTRYPKNLARVRVNTRYSYPTKIPFGYFQIPEIHTQGPFFGYPYPTPIPNGFFPRVHNPASSFQLHISLLISLGLGKITILYFGHLEIWEIQKLQNIYKIANI